VVNDTRPQWARMTRPLPTNSCPPAIPVHQSFLSTKMNLWQRLTDRLADALECEVSLE
jgi:hypothetical protein